MTRLVLIRHGLAQCAVDSIVGGIKGCTGLAGDGRRQAERLRDRLVRTGELAGANAVYTSVLPRAIETAEIIAPGLGPAGEFPAKQDADLCELNPGEADAITWEDYRERYNVDMAVNPYAPIAPGGESIAQFLTRVGTTLTRIVADHPGQTVVIAAHGGIIWGSLSTLAKVQLQPTVTFEVQNTSITEWQVEPDHTALLRYNDFAHLQEG